MSLVSRAPRLALVFSLLLANPLPATGQQAPSARDNVVTRTKTVPATSTREPGWLYKGSDITPDPDWMFGTLPNGLRYAVRRNGVPPGQVSVRVRIDAGSLMESDSERGFAHLIEHLSFRGSVYVPDGEAKRVWQRMGTTFGSDTNAQTTPTETVYKLDLPSATQAGLDESLKIMAGMMDKPNITAEALNAERPVVLAEQREQPGAQVRFGDAVRSAFFAGQPLADRSPIGNIKTLEEATPESVAAFHNRWYRPDRTVVIVAGDFDPAVFEELVAKNFSGWKADGPAPAEPDFGKPDPAQPTTRAIVEPTLPPIVTIAILRPWTYRDDTILFNQKRLVDLLALRLINRRLETRARAGGSYIQANASLDDVSRSANGTFIDLVPVGEDWEPALRDVRAVIADAQATPPSRAEIDRELAELDAGMKAAVDTAKAEAAAKQADDLVQALDIRETVTTAATAYDILQDAKRKGMFAPDTVLASTKRVFMGDATHAVINTRTAEEGTAEKLATALKSDTSGLAGKRKAQRPIQFSRLPKIGSAGKVVSRAPVPELGIEKVVFANGVRLMLFPSTTEANRVYVRVRFGGGLTALPADRTTPAWAGNLALVPSGIDKFGQEALDALTTGRRIGLDFGIDDDAFTLSATTSPEDLRDQLYLMATKLAKPGWDPNPVTRARVVAQAGYAGYASSPGGILSRDLDGLLHAGDPRWMTPTREQIDALTPASFRALWEPILQSGPIEVQVFGDMKSEDAIAAVARSIGALKPRQPAQTSNAPIRFPAHVDTPVMLTHGGPENQAVSVIAWPTGGGVEGVSEGRRLDVLAAVFSDRLFDRLRSGAGVSYSPSVDSQWPVGLNGGGRIIAVGQVPPDKVGYFFTLAREIAADLVAKPIDDDELKRTIGPLIQYVVRSSTGNSFWLNQLAGATYDDRRIAAVATIGRDLASITPAQLQEAAAKYLRPDKDWTLAVVPEAVAK